MSSTFLYQTLFLISLWVGVLHNSLFAQITPLHKSSRTFAVIIGISDYQDAAIPDLRFAHKDAEAFANYMRSPAGGTLDGDHLKVLLNEQATAGRIAEALDALVEQVKEGDQVIIYFSGHGDVERKTVSQPGFLLAWDAPSRVYMGGGTYSLSFLQEIVTTLSTQNLAKVTVITDACHAGKLSGSQIGGAQLTSANLARQYANEVKILSCQPNEFSLEGEQWGGGRGNFSYHLVEGLYGLADRNEDDIVTVGELDRYLEDNVTSEAAPQSQVPMMLGNKTDRLVTVNRDLLANLKKDKSGQMAVFAAMESRGLEAEEFVNADSVNRKVYEAFKLAILEKRLLEPAGNCAEEYYNQLINIEGISPLLGVMKRNYAAALQDDAQQAINIWLKADVQELQCIGKSLKINPLPGQLARAAELLGESHYMHRSLMARKLLFEGILHKVHRNPDEKLARECLNLFNKSLDLEPQSPLPWHQMSKVYVTNLRYPDSAFICAEQARILAPNWVLPFADLSQPLMSQNNPASLELSRQALLKAEAIDSLHPYVINRWAHWFYYHEGETNLLKSATLFEKYKKSGGSLYPCWFNDYGQLLIELGRYDEAEALVLQAFTLDSTNLGLITTLGFLYNKTKRFAEAEIILKKAIAKDSSYTPGWHHLGLTYFNTRQYAEAELAFKKAVSLDSTYIKAWNLLGKTYSNTRLYAEAELMFYRAIALDSTNAHYWYNLGITYFNTRKYAEAEMVLKKAVTLDSTYTSAWNYLGLIYNQNQRYPEAEFALKNAVCYDSTYTSAWNNLGLVYLNTFRFNEAEMVLKKAISLDAKLANPRKHLGMVYLKTNRSEEAQKSFLEAITINPDYPAALLGMTYFFNSQGKTKEAIEYVEQAINKGITFKELETDNELTSLRSMPEWTALMNKHFPDTVKEK